MEKKLSVVSKDGAKKTIKIKLTLGSETKEITIKDNQDDAENFRAMCRELKKFQDELDNKL